MTTTEKSKTACLRELINRKVKVVGIMLTIGSAVAVFSVAVMVLGAGVATGQTTSMGSGQAYPNKPIRIVTSEAGAPPDILLRTIGPGFSGSLGEQVIVDNRVSGVIPIVIVAKAPPDGYTLLVGASPVWTEPLLRKTPYDPLKDFSPITLLVRSPNILVAHSSLPVKSVKDLIALAKAKPGELNYASGATGAANHLAAELFKSMTGVNIVRIPYKGGAGAINAILGNEVQLMFGPAPGVAPHVKSGKLRALAVTSANPSTLAPGLPTVAETVPGFEAAGAIAIFAPARTPAALINRLNKEIGRALNQAEVKEKLFSIGLEIIGSSPEQLTAVMKSEMTRLGKVIKDADIRAD